MSTDTAFDAHRARVKFYQSLGDQYKGNMNEFARALPALVFGYKLGSSVVIEDRTPSDMDGIVLKVTIT